MSVSVCFCVIHFFVLKLQFRKELLLRVLSNCDELMQDFSVAKQTYVVNMVKPYMIKALFMLYL